MNIENLSLEELSNLCREKPCEMAHIIQTMQTDIAEMKQEHIEMKQERIVNKFLVIVECNNKSAIVVYAKRFAFVNFYLKNE